MGNTYLVRGGTPLSGVVKLSGAKNVALKVIIAAFLFNQKLYFSNIPQIKDVEVLINLIKKLGSAAFFYKKKSFTN